MRIVVPLPPRFSMAIPTDILIFPKHVLRYNDRHYKFYATITTLLFNRDIIPAWN